MRYSHGHHSKQPKELDFAADAIQQQMKDMFMKEEIGMINEKGEIHGTMTTRKKGNENNDKENFEITTL